MDPALQVPQHRSFASDITAASAGTPLDLPNLRLSPSGGRINRRIVKKFKPVFAHRPVVIALGVENITEVVVKQ